MTQIARFDSWVARGPFSSADLGIYRIIYAVAVLFTVPDITWIAQYPDFMFNAPPGPIMLFSGFPPAAVLIVLEVLRSTCLALLALGIWTRYVSIATWLMLTLTYGLTYTLGKVDHTILMVMVPLVMAFSGWGNRFSIDALRRPVPITQQQWPLRLLALLIAWGFFAAAMTKLLTGWLSLSSQAARGYFVLGYVTEDRTHLLAQWMAAHDVAAIWELADWATVIFEFSILFALPWWPAFRIALAVATTFHLGVLLVLNIDFSHAVLAYAAFVSWSAIGRRVGDSDVGRAIRDGIGHRRWIRGSPTLPVVAGVMVVATAATAWWLMTAPAGRIDTGPMAGHVIIVAGALVGIGHLAAQLRRGIRAVAGGRHRRGQPSCLPPSTAAR